MPAVSSRDGSKVLWKGSQKDSFCRLQSNYRGFSAFYLLFQVLFGEIYFAPSDINVVGPNVASMFAGPRRKHETHMFDLRTPKEKQKIVC